MRVVTKNLGLLLAKLNKEGRKESAGVVVEPIKPSHKVAHFIGFNPPTTFNSISARPSIHPTASIGPFSTIIGDVTIMEKVYVAPNVTIRADEGTPFFIGANTNIQDRVILHGKKGEKLLVEDKYYSIYIGQRVSCAHGAIIHGPCKLGDDVFLGFNTIVFNSTVGEGSFISHNSIVMGVELPANSFVPLGSVIDTQDKADSLELVPSSQKEFAKEVQLVNLQLAAYTRYY